LRPGLGPGASVALGASQRTARCGCGGDTLRRCLILRWLILRFLTLCWLLIVVRSRGG
jgi:hypothetical protein